MQAVTKSPSRHRATTSMYTCKHFAFAWCCHRNATRALIANPPNSAQLGGMPYHSAKLHVGPCNNVGMRPRTDTQTHRRALPQYISRRLRLTRNVIKNGCQYFFSQGTNHWDTDPYSSAPAGSPTQNICHPSLWDRSLLHTKNSILLLKLCVFIHFYTLILR